MGRACARLFGGTHDLVLTDAAGPALESFAAELRGESFIVIGAHAGDLGDDALLGLLMADMGGDLPFALVHTAGLSPALADARALMAVNLVATVKLLDALEPVLRPGSAGVLIASSAGHMMPKMPEVQAIMADPLATDFLDRIGAVVDRMAVGSPGGPGGISYSLSKQEVLALVERRAMVWGPRGARLSSISPGMILTPMGQREMEKSVGGTQVAEAAPMGRIGVPMDIALAAQFLCSDAASFITGCDLKVDGGSTAVMLQMLAGRGG